MKTISFHCRPRSALILVLFTLLGSAFFLGNLSHSFAFDPGLNAALDCDNLTFQTWFSGSGSPGYWQVETTTRWYGVSAAQSSPLSHSSPSYSYIEAGVTGPGHLYFWWKVSCGSDSYLYLDGLPSGGPSITGEVGWTLENVFIPPGYHDLFWKYVQGFLSGGVDAGWLDAVSWYPTWPTLVVRGLDNRIYYRGYDEQSQAWGGWDNVPTGATLDSPAAAVFENHFAGTYSDNQLNLVVRGMDGTSLWYGSVDIEDPRIGFSGWWQLPGATMSAPTLTANGQGGSTSDVMCLVVRGLDNRVYYCLYGYDERDDSWGWYDWNVIPNGVTGDSPAAAMLGNELIVVVRGMDGNTLWYTKIQWTNNTVLKGWTLISGATPSKPVLVAAQDVNSASDTPTMLYLVVRGMDNGIWYRQWWPDGSPPSMGSWTKLPGATNDAPAACWWWTGFVAPNGPYLHLAVRGLDGNTLWHTRWFKDNNWSLINGATPSAPTLTG